MGKVLVFYDSKTGHTRQMAEYVAEGVREIPKIELRLRSVDEASVDDLLWADGIALGTPTCLGLESWKMKRFWDEATPKLWGKMDGKFGCAFSSSGGWGGGAELTCQALLTILMNFGILVFGVTDYVAKQFTLHYGAVMAGKPKNEAEIAACRRLGKRLAQWVAFYIDKQEDQHPGPMKERK